MTEKKKYSSSRWFEFNQKNDEELLKHVQVDVFKATGRGGQKKNKTSNAIRLTLRHLMVTESASRSKLENLKKAIKKLRLAIALDLYEGLQKRPKWDSVPAIISRYIQSELIRINSKNPDLPLFFGYLIDFLIQCRGDWKEVAEVFSTTQSQIHKFLAKNGFLIEKTRYITKEFKEKKRMIE